MDIQFRNQIIKQEYERLQKKGYRSEMVTEILAYKYCISPNRIFAIVAEKNQKQETEIE